MATPLINENRLPDVPDLAAAIAAPMQSPAFPASKPVPPPDQADDAFQSLLAFASLQQKIRQDRLNRDSGNAVPEDIAEMQELLLDEVLQAVAHRARALTGADGIAIALAHDDEIVCRASAGSIAPDAGAKLNPKSGFSGACFRTGQVVHSDNVEADPRVNVQAARQLSARSMVAVPVAGKYNVIGLVEAFSYQPCAFGETHVRTLKLLAELIVAAMRPEEEARAALISEEVAARTGQPDIELDAVKPQAAIEQPASATTLDSPQQLPTSQASPHVIRHSRPGLIVVCAIVLSAIVLGSVAWIFVRPRLHRAQVNSSPEPNLHVESQPAQLTDDASLELSPPNGQQLSVLPQVTGIRHWSSGDATSVVIDLQDQVQYEAHRLTNPERIYFDLHDTVLAPGLNGKTTEIGDPLVMRVRVAQPVPGTTRVVLDTKGGSNFSVSLEPDPYRLVVEVRKIGVASRSNAENLAPAATPTDAKTVSAPAPGSGPRIVLDAGHGGWDLGSTGQLGVLEKDLTLDVVQRLATLLETRLGAEVIYTRKYDTYVALERRAELANQQHAELFVSVHANYSSLPSARGVETYYTDTFSSANAHSHDGNAVLQGVSFANVDIRAKVRDSHRFAASIQRALYGSLAAKNPGLQNRGVKQADYVVLTGTTMPAVLAEVSFVSSLADEKHLQDDAYRQQIAEALFKGIAAFVEKKAAMVAKQ